MKGIWKELDCWRSPSGTPLTYILTVKESGNVHFPDRSVVLTGNETTKIREVFNASCSYDRSCYGT